MPKCLYLLCPTDCLETIINNTFSDDNYFYASLGNSFVADTKSVACIKRLVEKHKIEKIRFILSTDNKVVLDALGEQYFSRMRRLRGFYLEMEKQNKRSEVLTQNRDREFSVISYYLNQKVKRLQLDLNTLPNNPIHISGKIFNRNLDSFSPIYSDLVCLETFHLN